MDEIRNANQSDSFDEPLEAQSNERIILNDTYFEAARGAVTVDGMAYFF